MTAPLGGLPTNCKSMVIAPQDGQRDVFRSLLHPVVVLLSGHFAPWWSACRSTYKGTYVHVVIEGGPNSLTPVFDCILR